MTNADEIRELIASWIVDSGAPDDPNHSPIAVAITRARSDEEVELLARALIANKRAAPGGFGLRAAPQIKRVAAILAVG